MAIVLLYLLTLVFLYIMQGKQEKTEILRFREVIRAIKAETIHEYVETEPADDIPMEHEVEDEFMDLSDFTPEELLNELNKK